MVKSLNIDIGQPIFIIGNPRSGTSLLRLTLNSHPLICIPPESHFFLWLEKKYHSWSSSDGFNQYLDDLFNSTKFETWNLDRSNLELFLTSSSPTNYRELNALVYAHYVKVNQPNSIYWGDKNKLWKDQLHKVLEYYPSARFIHIHRDGRDVACSYKELHAKNISSKYAPKLPYEIASIAEKWKENINFLLDFEKTVNEEQILRISYESIIENQEKASKELCSFLKLEYPKDGMSHLQIKGLGNDEPEEFLQWKEKTNQPIDKKNVGKFLEALDPTEIETFNAICLNELAALGYR